MGSAKVMCKLNLPSFPAKAGKLAGSSFEGARVKTLPLSEALKAPVGMSQTPDRAGPGRPHKLCENTRDYSGSLTENC